MCRYGASSGALAPPLDLKYALRICTHHRKTRACVQIYSFMGLYEVSPSIRPRFGVLVLIGGLVMQEAVELALRVDVPLAKEKANKPESDEVKKRLWLMIARHLIEVGASPGRRARSAKT